ncbi:MAG: hypothetical protein HY331_14390, partial [Chloroflexi bacterium]|nr:hypothetical protein [Chloroflexota bacterium]
MLEDLDLNRIQDEGARQAIVRLLNLVEQLAAENRTLRDENHRLKGEQGKPAIKSNTPPPPDHSSEDERRTPKDWHKSSKIDRVPIHRTEDLRLERSQLPADAEFKGYESVVIQALVFRAENVCFRKEKDSSPSLGETYLAPLPAGYTGQFGPGLKSLAIVLGFAANVTEPKLLRLFHSVGVRISAGELSNLLIKDQEPFHAEKTAVTLAGLASAPWQQIDDTGTRVNGQNQHCQILGNPLCTAYVTTATKDRLTVIDVLQNQAERMYLLNEEALSSLAAVGLSAAVRRRLTALPRDGPQPEAAFTAWLT